MWRTRVVTHGYCYGRRVSGDTLISIGSGRSSFVKFVVEAHTTSTCRTCADLCVTGCKCGTWRAAQMEVDMTFGMVWWESMQVGANSRHQSGEVRERKQQVLVRLSENGRRSLMLKILTVWGCSERFGHVV